MKVMMIHHPYSCRKEDFPPFAMALGFFDGVHRGHQKVISTAVQIAKENNWKSAVMTFDPHPSIVLGNKKKTVKYITPLKEKIEHISSLGVDYLFVIRFTSAFASLDPEEFVDRYITNLHVCHAVGGFDYTYGKFGKGTMDSMSVHAKGNFDVTVVSKLEDSQEKISSTGIRALLSDGCMVEAESLLGRPYTTKGTVVHGEKRGSTIGFPTANISMIEDYLIPKPGVYAVRIFVSGRWENGVCNIGYKPTFNDSHQSELTVEVHILQFKGSIYGEEVAIEWVKRIRDEQKFSGIEELKQQIVNDVQKATHYLNSKKK